MEENNIVLRAKKGDDQAFEKLIKAYESKMYKTAKSILECEDDINEAIQQTIILIYDKLYQLRNEEKIGSWIIRILINQCKKIYKQNELRNKKNINLEDNIERINISDEKDDYSFVNDAIKRLDIKYREIIILYYYDELKIKDIARILKMPLGTIKTRLNRGRKKLNEILEEVKRKCNKINMFLIVQKMLLIIQ